MKIHRFFQPHFRLIYLFIWGLMISGLHDLSWLIMLNIGVMSAFFIMLGCHSKSFFSYLKPWFALLIFITLIWATLSWRIGELGVELNFQGIQLAKILSLRMHLLLFSLWFFLWNINDVVLLQALGKLPLPEKLVQLFVLTVRYIALLGEVRKKMDIAMRARGFRAGFNRRTLYVTAQNVALLLLHALLKAEVAQIVLKCRGFQFGKKKEKSNVDG
ncbi:energy-coupling factor transporter transmembrane component T [Rodentibacter haemolyticus]|uniref:Energy-coupling factor transporter transmembrane protein EcfT n=1 Tax=Rodentibacter haemolyticus TaxID=2778911 RepID=A0ABX6UY21_9PAST|nr:energy-coupling factor transporter transmembrane component T [Rodentibacter haemolyticus]QPB42374.1 energy-coupling factor transporter transmembrane protein EcfT [Rodentibacter haemolyticus]